MWKMSAWQGLILQAQPPGQAQGVARCNRVQCSAVPLPTTVPWANRFAWVTCDQGGTRGMAQRFSGAAGQRQHHTAGACAVAGSAAAPHNERCGVAQAARLRLVNHNVLPGGSGGTRAGVTWSWAGASGAAGLAPPQSQLVHAAQPQSSTGGPTMEGLSR